MRNNLNISNRRGYLVTSTNASNTGITANAVLPCAPEANFEADQAVFCAGATVQFTDKSSFEIQRHGNGTSQEVRQAVPAENPTVTYNSPGNYIEARSNQQQWY